MLDANELKELFQKSKHSKRDFAETRLQIATTAYLRGQIRNGKNIIKVQRPFDCIFLHPVNESKDEKEAMWAKAKGILPGAYDFLFWWNFNAAQPPIIKSGAIELKSKTGQLSAVQQDFRYNFEQIGGVTALCRKVSEVRDTLISWGLPCKNHQCIEPRLSHEELLALQMEIYKI